MSSPAALAIEHVSIETLVPDPHNAREHGERNLLAIRESLERFGQVEPLVVQRASRRVIGGNGRLEAMRMLGWREAAVVLVDLPDSAALALALALNRTGELATWNEENLAAALRALSEEEGGLVGVGWSREEMLAALADPQEGAGVAAAKDALRSKFLVPPFSVLDSRQGYWQERRRAWLALGIRSEEGRGSNLLNFSDAVQLRRKLKPGERRANGGDPYQGGDAWASSGTSIFDPVLTELAVRWWCPPGGAVLDPFAGGSVRGVVTAFLGRSYTGVDLRDDQVAANREQLAAIQAPQPERRREAFFTSDPAALTPVEFRGGIWLKRDDAFRIGTAGNGGKVRSCLSIASGARHGLVTAGSRSSPQVNIVAGVAKALGISCRAHTPRGELGPEVQAAVENGAELVQHGAGYNTVIVARAREDAQERGWLEVPFGMECAEAVDATRKQVANIPAEARRLVVPVVSGMSLAGILWGLRDLGRSLPVLGVVVGADPRARLERWAPPGWSQQCELVPAGIKYEREAERTSWEGVQLDPIYEAKTLPFLQPGDCLWIVGLRASAAQADAEPPQSEGGSARWICGDSLEELGKLPAESSDLVLSCPPYADLERYSQDPRDLSNMPWPEFLQAYRSIIAASVRALRPDRFACFVVGEVRERNEAGCYRGLVPETIRAFEDAGARLYNEAIMVNAIGTLPLRAGRIFQASRKLGKVHQNVLVFCKGDPRRAAEAVGPVDCGAEDLAAQGEAQQHDAGEPDEEAESGREEGAAAGAE